MKLINRKYTISEFVCPKCNGTFPLPRVGNQREKGHIKDLWCPKCKQRVKTKEIRSIDYVKTMLGDDLHGD